MKITTVLDVAMSGTYQTWRHATESGKAAQRYTRDALARYEGKLPGADADPVFNACGLTSDDYWYRPGMAMLEKYGFHARSMRMNSHGFAGIPTDAKDVRPQVERYLEQLNRVGIKAERVHGAGDSEGGLIWRQALTTDKQLRPLVSGLTTNGTPHGGIRLCASDGLTQRTEHLWITPPGARDLLISSPIMRDMNAAWDDTLAAMRTLDPSFRVNSVASRLASHEHDGLVPVHSAWLPGDPEVVTNFVTPGKHSLNYAFGRDHTENFQTLMACFGSTDPAHIARATQANAVAQSLAAQRALR